MFPSRILSRMRLSRVNLAALIDDDVSFQQGVHNSMVDPCALVRMGQLVQLPSGTDKIQAMLIKICV